MFKKGQKVYSILRGWGEVTEDKHSESYPLFVMFKDWSGSYTLDGKSIYSDLYPEIYHTEPVITVPKRRVEHKGWIQVCNKAVGDGYNISSCIATSKELLDKWFSDKDDYTKQEITFYTEE